MKRSAFPYLLTIPLLAFIFVFLVYPLGFGFYLSLTAWNGISDVPKFVGLLNFERLIADRTFYTSLFNTVTYSIFEVGGTVLLGLALAVLIDSKVKGWKLFRAAFYLPVMLTSAVTSLLWVRMLDPVMGPLNQFLKIVGLGALALPWLGSAKTALAAIILKDIWQFAGFPMLLFLGGLTQIPMSVYESARMDGAGGWQIFSRITFPLLKNIFIITIALSLIYSFKVFDTVFVMTLGGPGFSTQTLATYTYFSGFGFHYPAFEFGYASAIAFTLFVIVLAMTSVYLRRAKLGELEL